MTASSDECPPSIDLTTAPAPPSPRGPLHEHMKLPALRAAHAYTTAHRRLYTRRERIYNRNQPHLVAERLHLTEEHAAPTQNPALSHLSRACAAAGYAQSTLIVTVSLCLALFFLHFASALLADVRRKTRLRADDLSTEARECAAEWRRNACEDTAGHHTPALVTLCEKWAACERRGAFAGTDALSASLWAETLAEVVNAFADRISSTSVVLTILAAVGLVFCMSTAAFGYLHRRLFDRRLTMERRDDAPSLSAALIKDDSAFHGGSPPALSGRTQPLAVGYRDFGKEEM